MGNNLTKGGAVENQHGEIMGYRELSRMALMRAIAKPTSFCLVVGMMAAVAMVVVGCSSVSRMPLDETLTGRQLVMTTISDPHVWAMSPQRNWLEECDVVARQNPDAVFYHEWQHKFSNCVAKGDVQFSASNGVLSNLVQPLIYSGSVVGSAFLIGDGLSKSGPTVNGGGASQSQSQTIPKTHGR